MIEQLKITNVLTRVRELLSLLSCIFWCASSCNYRKYCNNKCPLFMVLRPS